jgi:PAS domain S-box-containing protein
VRGRDLAAAGAVVLLCAAAAVWLVSVSNHTDDKALITSIAVIGTLSFVFSGLFAIWRRPENRTGVLLVATGFLWLLSALTTANNAWVFTLGFVFNSAAFGAFGHLLLAFPSGRLESRFHRLLVVVIWFDLIVPAVALLLVGGTDRACIEACPESTITVWQSDRAAQVILAFASLAAVSILVVVLFALAQRWRHASPALRRVLGPVYATSALSLFLLLVALGVSEFSQDAGRPIELMALAAFAAVPFAFLAGILKSRLARSGVADLLLELTHGTPIRDALARTLGDPELDIAYWLPETGRYVSADGKPLQEGNGSRHVTLVEHAGRPTAALLHDPMLTDEPELIEATAAAAGLWLDNERLQAKLRAQIEFLETIVNASPSLLCSLDREGRVVNLNHAARVASGYLDEEEVRWQPFWDVFVPPEERDGSRTRFEEAAPFHREAGFEHTFVNRAGQELTIAWSTAPLYDEQGNVRNVVCGGLDVTERERQHKQLQASGQRLQAAIEASPVAIVEYALDDTIARWNPAAERMFGWSAEDVVGGRARHLPFERQAELTELMARVRAGETYTGVETTRVRKDGATIDVEVSAAPIRDPAGNVVSHMALFADITDRRRQEEQLLASRARIVEAGDEARRRLERNLHDGAQQRLVALSLALRLAQSKVGTDPEAAETVLESAREELAAALDELRELARGIHPAVLTDRGLPAALEALASRSPIPVEIDAPEDELPRPVEAAAYYVVAEALANVAKYAGASGATVRICRENGRALVEVGDDGVGGADPAAGTGLRGLSDRVEALGGTLSVDSPPGGGTRVSVEIPLNAQSRTT